jgi:5-methylcytosine-specific restriction endonuclease McrA
MSQAPTTAPGRAALVTAQGIPYRGRVLVVESAPPDTGGAVNSKRKGTRNEHRSRLLLEAAGYAVTRAAGSLGVWDLINDPRDPIPSFRVGGKILVRKSEFNAWRTRREARRGSVYAATLLARADAASLEAVRQRRELHLMEMVHRRDKRRVVAKTQREALFDTLGRRCVDCGATDRLTFDHITPWSHGGKTELANLRVLCQPCNSRRGNRGSHSSERSICYNALPANPPVPRWSSR